MLNIALLKEILIALLSFIALIKSADYAIGAVSRFAKKIGISEYFIGLVIVSVGTSIPEMTTAIMGSIIAHSTQFTEVGQLIIGNLIGASIIDITIVVGISAIVARHLKIKSTPLEKTKLPMLMLVIFPMLLGIDGLFSRIDGIIMLSSFAVYIFLLWKEERRRGKIKGDIKLKKIYLDIIIFGVSVPILLLSAEYLVTSAVKLATSFHISPYIIGLTFISIGTTLPELTVQLRSVLKGHKELGFGNALGSVVTNVSMIVGIAAVINPISFGRKIFVNSMSFLITSLFIATLFLGKREITWKEGICLLLLYFTFLISSGVISFF